MKKMIFTLMMMVVALNLKATHHLTYFVYVESVFPQGYWKDADLAYENQGVFLYPHQYTDLFGTVKVDFYRKLLDRLGEHHDFYEKVKLEGNVLKQANHREYYDTLHFAVEEGLTEDQLTTVRNELTATVLGAGECQAIQLSHYQGGKKASTELLDYSTLDYPLFQLVSAEGKKGEPVTRVVETRVHDTVYETQRDTVFKSQESTATDDPADTCWDRYLWLGIILILVIMIFRMRKR